MNRAALIAGMALVGTVVGCRPPPTDAAMARVELGQAGAGPSVPLPSPGTIGAIWAQSSQPMRLVYGVPGQPVLVSLECRRAATPAASIQITRYAPADEGAGALLALIGNRMVARVAVDATMRSGKRVWQGKAPASLPAWDALADPVDATVTVPGAGLVRLNPSPLPVEMVKACRGVERPLLPADRL